MKPSVTTCICLLLFLFFASDKSWSQATINMGLNIGAGSKGFFPNGKGGLGGSVEYVGMLWKQGGVRVYAGYDWFDQRQPKNIDPQVLSDSMIHYPSLFKDISVLPLRMGYQQFLFKDAAFVYAEAGVAYWITSYPVTKRSMLTYALGTGYRFDVKEKQYVQLSFFYNHNKMKVPMNRNYFNFRAAYGLPLRKRIK